VNFDIYNVFNATFVFGLNPTFGGSWRLPVAVTVGTEAFLSGRLFQVGVELTFTNLTRMLRAGEIGMSAGSRLKGDKNYDVRAERSFR
jgi:hypothetical protein